PRRSSDLLAPALGLCRSRTRIDAPPESGGLNEPPPAVPGCACGCAPPSSRIPSPRPWCAWPRPGRRSGRPSSMTPWCPSCPGRSRTCCRPRTPCSPSPRRGARPRPRARRASRSPPRRSSDLASACRCRHPCRRVAWLHSLASRRRWGGCPRVPAIGMPEARAGIGSGTVPPGSASGKRRGLPPGAGTWHCAAIEDRLETRPMGKRKDLRLGKPLEDKIPFSLGVVSSGRFLHTAGITARDRDGEIVGVGDVAAQTRQCYENLGDILEAAGADWGDVIKYTTYTTDIQ